MFKIWYALLPLFKSFCTSMPDNGLYEDENM